MCQEKGIVLSFSVSIVKRMVGCWVLLSVNSNCVCQFRISTWALLISIVHRASLPKRDEWRGVFLKILCYFVGRGMKYNDLAISTKFVEVIGHPMEVEMLTFRTLALQTEGLSWQKKKIDISYPGAIFVPKATPLICLSVVVGLVQSGAEKEYPSSVLWSHVDRKDPKVLKGFPC